MTDDNSDLNKLLGAGCLDLLGPGFDEIKKALAVARNERTRMFLRQYDPQIAARVMRVDEKSDSSAYEKGTAATTIQRIVRGHLHRKVFDLKLFEQFEKDEAERQRLQDLHVREGEAILRTSTATKRIHDMKLISRNKRAIYNHKAHLIQRQFRLWKTRKKKENCVDANVPS